eukprot:9482932-Pyramimonas_sp.AAC.1
MKAWLLRCLPKGAKRVHAWLKHDQGEDLEHLATPSEVLQLPEGLMAYREKYWMGLLGSQP